jgi:hypothetical protein
MIPPISKRKGKPSRRIKPRQIGELQNTPLNELLPLTDLFCHSTETIFSFGTTDRIFVPSKSQT